MAILDRCGLPLAVSRHAADHHEVTLVRLSFDFYMIEAIAEILIADEAHDSDTLNQQLRPQGIEMISPHRSNRNIKTQDGRRRGRYERRWIAERCSARRNGIVDYACAGKIARQLPRVCTVRGDLHHA